jgi:peroxiredoxin (alkyl hydroperoxide reductase subunit C)
MHPEGHATHAHETRAHEAPRIPLIGEEAPAFSAETTQGRINFPEDYRGKWVILFSHPADFTPVCTTEFIGLARLQDELAKLGCELVGLSIDSVFSHLAWLRTIQERIRYKGEAGVEVRFPVIADLGMEVAAKYGMIHPGASATSAVRGVFIIDPEAKVRAILYYPMQNGRNTSELKRLLLALQTADAHHVATPADWQPGEDVIVPPPRTTEQVESRLSEGYQCLDWFMCLKKAPQ